MTDEPESAPNPGPLDRFFGLSEANTSPGAEMRAGLTTFLTMAYILFVNPSILAQAIQIEDANVTAQLLTATALAACFGTLVMGLVARFPFALAPGMGLNAYFAFTVVLGMGIPWQTALGAVFISGLVFVLLSFGGVRQAIVNAIPGDLQIATSAGIGLFLAIIGASNAGIVADHPVTLVTLGDVASPGVALALGGFLITAVLMALRVRGAILAGIVLTSVAAVVLGAPVFDGEAFGGLSEGVIRAPAWPVDLFAKLDLTAALSLGLLDVVFIFFFVDLFDTAGTLVGLGHKAGYMDEEGRLPGASRAFFSDAIATCFGAILGTSTTTSYVESAAGVEEGGRTGLTAVAVALLFGLSIFLWPLASAVPLVATAPALIIVGALMMSHIGEVDWSDVRVSVPAFVTIIGMPLTYSIANGISFGIISWVVIHLLSGKGRDVHPILYVLAVLLVVRYAWLGGA
ncbi:NCS2 family permease [Persicimonas caeni]|uniref:NCS2 family permease n=1 Tax=Persicimonas caeni TaxID=2292766 RepID=A0A4Y6PZ62_PERCE|nr:NCS2 family permease [Persicimonas caeni]QDG53035.1 NCS2 family permease [Persicimonas caeni]QED34257.1 NCS2 family permease [Persicimonas caeni]